MTLSTELNEAIQKSLPTMVGEELKKVLAKAEADAAKVSELTAKLAETVERLDAETKRGVSQKIQINELIALGIRSEDLNEQERNLKVTIAESKVANAEALSKQAFDMVGLVFRNQQVMRHNYSSVPVPYTTGVNGCTSTHIQNHNTSETLTEEIK